MSDIVIPAGGAVDMAYDEAAERWQPEGVVDRPWEPGDYKPTARGAASPGWLLCDGSSYLRADYPELFAVIGTTYGSADGTHFNVPDLRDKLLVGGTPGAGGGTQSPTATWDHGGHTHNLDYGLSGAGLYINQGGQAGSASYTYNVGLTSAGGPWTIGIALTSTQSGAGNPSTHAIYKYGVANWVIKT